MARECPSKGRSKGKGGKGKGPVLAKGSSKGPATGCWTCGGNHFQRECLAQKGKGKGTKGLYAVGDSWDNWEHAWEPFANAQVLSSCQLVKTHNSFAPLQEGDMDEDSPKPRDQSSETQLIAKGDGVESDHREASVEHVHREATSSRITQTLGLADFVKQRVRQSEVKKARKSVMPNLRGTPRGVTADQEQQRLHHLRLFQTIEPEGLNNAAEVRPKWEVIELAVDSGATETVIGEDMLKSVHLRESAASRRGVKYEVANGVQIPNLGEKAFGGYTDQEGFSRKITAQVCEVNKALLSVYKLVKAGNRVVFDPEGSYIEDLASEQRTWLQEQGGMYMLKMWVPTEGF